MEFLIPDENKVPLLTKKECKIIQKRLNQLLEKFLVKHKLSKEVKVKTDDILPTYLTIKIRFHHKIQIMRYSVYDYLYKELFSLSPNDKIQNRYKGSNFEFTYNALNLKF
jgi:hypothetical protein